MTQVLCPVPSSDPRPTLLHPEALKLAFHSVKPALSKWLIERIHEEVAPWVEGEVTTAIQQSSADAYRAVRFLEDQHGWAGDVDLVVIINTMMREVPRFLPRITLEWMTRARIRFPARSGDLIVFLDDWNLQRTGRVQAINRKAAAAEVLEENGRQHAVAAEHVVANRTTGQDASLGHHALMAPEVNEKVVQFR